MPIWLNVLITNGNTGMAGSETMILLTQYYNFRQLTHYMLTNGIADMAGVVTFITFYIIPCSYHYETDFEKTLFGIAIWHLTIVQKWANGKEFGVSILPASNT